MKQAKPAKHSPVKHSPGKFLPISLSEAKARGWNELDVIFVTGDAYVDHPSFGVPLLARLLESKGLRVGIIPQPDWRSKEPFMALGRPRLFFAVAAGAMDSMVAHYTPARKLRRDDAYTPGNRHGARPNRATIVYTSRLKEAYRDVPVVIGGIEASLRRFAHYDFWEDKVRRSALLDAKADLLVYGMGETPLLEMVRRLQKGEPFAYIKDLRGTAYIAATPPETGELLELPSFETVVSDKAAYGESFRLLSGEQNPACAKVVVQRHAERFLVCNPPAWPLSEQALDAIYALPFVKAPHPSYKEAIPAYEQIRNSITTHRGCFGGCAFCAITHHQGKTIQSRSEESVLRELERLAALPWFRGSVSDLGGPTANMFGLSCGNKEAGSKCRRESCLYPKVCGNLVTTDARSSRLLAKARKISGVRNVAVSSGVRYDLLERQPNYLRELVAHHVSGLLKVAPEHLTDRVTSVMRKPGHACFERFRDSFMRESAKAGKRQYIVPYFISGHPGCTLSDMVDLALVLKRLGMKVEQVQDFTPTPGTLSTCIYHTGVDPFTGEKVYVAKSDREKGLQKSLLLYHVPEERKSCMQALRECGREDAAEELFGPGRR
ncbi:cobalamin-binding radical SAM domain-containing iron-sulfur cluster-binding oxidoreductase [Geoanaerobacter pelophilus]|uniref:Cobalamin-binding radical SAM domain-containing iron-sulfur cluster-binding oxidoreductase n=1 Tax=Geoanaerobacter pelophilus TaxID=60036 RepID=A0ABQ0MPJ1_9BACT|nr:YgiQ family radical SAM protein [Geoanaerobacter pelophilus]GAW68987.1 cobalamin-binding radical SAM domain-containing iron-sulfur cluster-binding oxidoreductase [Geoanaerobacter pelophilus]